MAKQIFMFATYFIENLLVLSNGDLFLSTFASPNLLYSIDPKSHSPLARGVTTFPGNITGVTASVALPQPNHYALGGGLHTNFGFANNSMGLFVISTAFNSIVKTIPVPGTESMNGLAPLPHHPSTLLSADSTVGRLIRINTLTGSVDTAFSDPALAPNTVPPIGINGLKIRGDWLYYTNSDLATFGRIPIDQWGNKVGKAQVLATINGSPDDFSFDPFGNAYIAVHPDSVVKVTPSGKVSTIGEGDLYQQPTSTAVSPDGCTLYICTGGNFLASPATGGQVLKLSLS